MTFFTAPPRSVSFLQVPVKLRVKEICFGSQLQAICDALGELEGDFSGLTEGTEEGEKLGEQVGPGVIG